MSVDYNLFFGFWLYKSIKKYCVRAGDNLYKLSGVGEPLQKVVTVLIAELQTLYTVRSGSGTADLKKRVQVGLARLWAMQGNVDERHSMLA